VNVNKFIELWAERPTLFDIEGILPGTSSGAVAGKWLK
jgi:hypothetical protein